MPLFSRRKLGAQPGLDPFGLTIQPDPMSKMDTASRVLALAQETADKAIADAKQEAEQIISRARAEADRVIAEASSRAQGF